jgi:prepilin-type N-terminal cleavage/methylation domain-containing protein
MNSHTRTRALRHTKKNAGFTLVEMIVAMGLFVIVAYVASMALLGLVNANRQVRSRQLVVDNLGFVIENLVRDIRTSYAYHCGDPSGDLSSPRDCTIGDPYNNFIALTTDTPNSRGAGVGLSYQFETVNGKGVIAESVNGGPLQPITLDQVDIQQLHFVVNGSAPNDGISSRATLVLRAIVGEGTKSQAEYDIQTSVSQRKKDN